MLPSIKDVSWQGKRALVREDFNVPLHQGQIRDATRIDAALPTIRYLQQQGAHITLMSHLGRPQEGIKDADYSLAPVAAYLQQALDTEVVLFGLDDNIALQPNQIGLLENVRFYVGEKANDRALSERFAALADVFVMDAFAVAHRAQASTVGVAQAASQSVAGPLLEQELQAISTALRSPKAPVVAIVGGAKVSSKLDVLTNLLNVVDTLIVGGGIANTFLVAKGHNVGTSLYEASLVNTAKQILDKAQALGKTIWLPSDVIVASEMTEQAITKVKASDSVQDEDKIFDIGPQSIENMTSLLQQAHTILWNGPVGVFELTPFSAGTRALSHAVANSDAFSIAGGGDTIAAINQFDVAQGISYISTGGGAFLTLLEGKLLPAVEALKAQHTAVMS